MVGIVLYMWTPHRVFGVPRTHRVAGCSVSKLRGYNMFSARADWKKMTFSNGTDTDAFE